MVEPVTREDIDRVAERLAPSPGWFGGVVDDLASEAVRGGVYDASLLTPMGYWVSSEPADQWVPLRAGEPLPPLSYPPIPYPDMVGDLLREHVRRLERRERNTAMVLWGIHL